MERDLCTELDAHAKHYADMAPHTATITRLAFRCRTAVELGTRGGVSAWALLDGLPADGRLLSVDIDPGVRGLVPLRVHDDPRWELVTGDSLDAPLPAAADLALIDTDHTYERTLGEVRRADAIGCRVVALHDWRDEPVRRAVAEFMLGGGWSLTVEPSVWGLAVLERLP